MKLLNLLKDTQTFETEFGTFQLQLFYNGTDEAVVLSYGDLKSKKSFLVRIQTECIHHQLYRINYCDCNDQIANTLRLIREKQGILILLKASEGQGFVAQFTEKEDDSRDYSIAIQILKEYYKVDSIDLISINKRKIEIIGEQITINKKIWYKKDYVQFNPLLDNIIKRISKKELIPPYSNLDNGKKVLCIGDINIDFDTINLTHEVRGSGFNAWLAFNTSEYSPILWGKVGDDPNGKKVESEVKKIVAENLNMYAMLGVHYTKPTCEVKIFPSDDNSFFHYRYEKDNANDYDRDNLKKTLKLVDFESEDYIHIASYILFQYNYNIDDCKEFFRVFSSTKAKIIFDITRYTVKKKPNDFTIDHLGEILNDSKEMFLLITDLSSMKSLLNETNNLRNLKNDQINRVFETINTKYFICRRGEDDVKIQDIYERVDNSFIKLKESPHPYDDYHNSKDKRGYGDKITLAALNIISDQLT